MANVPIEIKNIFAHAKSLDDSPGTPSSSRLTEPDSRTPTIDPAIERHVVRRCDLRVIPPVFMMFMMTFWDRVNIGNAKIQGMTTELGLVGNEFNIATMILFIPFVLFELPANFILQKTKPYIWLSLLTFGCGITNLSMGFVDSYGALLGVRFLLGVFESGIGAGSVMVIASYYKRYELPSKLSLWYLSGIAGGAFGGLLAYGIVRMSGDAGLSGWRWIFIVEGSITAFAGILMYFWMVDWPEACQFLTADERVVLLSRLRADRLDELRMDRWDTKRLFSDWRIWIGTLMYFSVINSTYSTAFFSPSLLQSDMGYTAVKAQLMSFPPYALAVVGCLSFNMLSDRLRHRYGFIIGGVLIGTIGYAILLAQKEYPNMPVGAKYFALILLVSAPQIVQPLTVAWMMNNVSGHHKRAFASACQIGFGSAGGIVASNIYFSTDAPYFRVGYAVSLVLLLLNGLLATFLYFALRRENKARADGKRDYLVDGQTTNNLGDDHPDFRFVY